MLKERSGATPRRRWQRASRQRMPWDSAAFLAYVGAALVCLLAVPVVGRHASPWVLVSLCLLVAVIGAQSGFGGAAWAAGICWLFFNGFLVTGGAHVQWHGRADLIRLLVLGAAALGSVLVARVRISTRSRPGRTARRGAATTTGAHSGQVVPTVPLPRTAAAAERARRWFPRVGAGVRVRGRAPLEPLEGR